ncbi:MAG: DUF2207 domain-containing protein [Miniphocaeibacter sp.]|uniref:DUF2207 domain-containing protein n=1 Tax=Miniphocaeibacter sp. TaxID=3100973 RepID=UPI0017E69553|nr:DUF2207 domain-containing protein [Gallicola sp.]
MKKKYIKLLLTICILILTPNISFAAELNSVFIDVDLLDNGDGIITSNWDYNDDKNTEHYIIIGDLGNSIIKDFTVSHNGKPMEFVEEWNINGTFEEKAGKYGIVEKSDGYELCYGITEYGNNRFEVKYTVTNLVKQLKDAQVLYWKFINNELSESPKEFNITIGKGDYNFTSDDISSWSLGHMGKKSVKDGKAVFSSLEALEFDHYVTVLIKFDKNIFTIANKIDKDFMEVKEEAFKNTSYSIDNDGKGEGSAKIVKNKVNPKFIAGVALTAIALLVAGLGWQAKRVKSDKYLGINVNNLKIKKSQYKGQYSSQIPYKGNLEDLFIIIRDNYENYLSNYLAAYFLKWIQTKKIEGIKNDKNKIKAFKVLDREYSSTDYFENTIFGFLLQVVDDSDMFESNDFTKWIQKNHEDLFDLLDDVSDNSKEKLIELGYLEKTREVKTFSKYIKTNYTSKGEDLAANICKFENHINDYTSANNKDLDYDTLDEIMIYAALFGKVKKLSKEFKNIYPEYMDNSFYDFYTIMMITQISANASSTYDYSSTDSSGFSSLGGGGGSFGGGVGGGSR